MVDDRFSVWAIAEKELSNEPRIKKTGLTFHESLWLFTRDPYNRVWKNPHITGQYNLLPCPQPGALFSGSSNHSLTFLSYSNLHIQTTSHIPITTSLNSQPCFQGGIEARAQKVATHVRCHHALQGFGRLLGLTFLLRKIILRCPQKPKTNDNQPNKHHKQLVKTSQCHPQRK